MAVYAALSRTTYSSPFCRAPHRMQSGIGLARVHDRMYAPVLVSTPSRRPRDLVIPAHPVEVGGMKMELHSRADQHTSCNLLREWTHHRSAPASRSSSGNERHAAAQGKRTSFHRTSHFALRFKTCKAACCCCTVSAAVARGARALASYLRQLEYQYITSRALLAIRSTKPSAPSPLVS